MSEQKKTVKEKKLKEIDINKNIGGRDLSSKQSLQNKMMGTQMDRGTLKECMNKINKISCCRGNCFSYGECSSLLIHLQDAFSKVQDCLTGLSARHKLSFDSKLPSNYLNEKNNGGTLQNVRLYQYGQRLLIEYLSSDSSFMDESNSLRVFDYDDDVMNSTNLQEPDLKHSGSRGTLLEDVEHTDKLRDAHSLKCELMNSTRNFSELSLQTLKHCTPTYSWAEEEPEASVKKFKRTQEREKMLDSSGSRKLDHDDEVENSTKLQSQVITCATDKHTQVEPESKHSGACGTSSATFEHPDEVCIAQSFVGELPTSTNYSQRVTQTSKHSMPKSRQNFSLAKKELKAPMKKLKRTHELEEMLSDSSDAGEGLALVCTQNNISSSEFSDDDDINFKNNSSPPQKKVAKKRDIPILHCMHQESCMNQCGYSCSCISFGSLAEIDYVLTYFEVRGVFLVEIVGVFSSPKPIQIQVSTRSSNIDTDSTKSFDASWNELVLPHTSVAYAKNSKYVAYSDIIDNPSVIYSDTTNNSTVTYSGTRDDSTVTYSVSTDNSTVNYSNATDKVSQRRLRTTKTSRGEKTKPEESASHVVKSQQKSSHVVVPSRVAITASVLDVYRGLFDPVCNEDKSLTCLRHADIPGLSKPLIFSGQECSSLQIIKKISPFAIDPEPIYGNKCSLQNSENNEARSCPDLDGKLDKLCDSKTIHTKEASDSSNIWLNDYKIHEQFFHEMTPLLHAQNYEEIIAKIKHDLLQKLNSGSRHDSGWTHYSTLIEICDSRLFSDMSLIPCLFISGLSHFKLGNASGIITCTDHIKTATLELRRCDEYCLNVNFLGDSALCNLYLGDIHFLSHEYLGAGKYYHLAISRYSQNTVASKFRMIPPSLSTIHSKYGSSLRHVSKMVDAIQQYKLAIKMAKTPRDRLSANTSLGNLYQSVGENTTALTHYQQCIELSETLHDYVSLSWAHGNMGNAYLGLFQKDKALLHLHKALDLTLQYERTPQAIGRAYNNLGTAYQSLGELDKAQEHYEYALGQAVYGNDKAGHGRVRGNMGNILMLRKKYKEAIEQYSEVLSLSKDLATKSTAHHNRGCAYYECGETKMLELYGEHVDQQEEEKSLVSEPKVYFHGPNFKDKMGSMNPHITTEIISQYFMKGCKDLCEVVEFHESHLENIKGSSNGLTLSVSLFETNSRTFHRLQDCYVNLGEYCKALLVAEQSRARTLGELMLKRKVWQLQMPLNSPMPLEDIVAVVAYTNHPVFYLSYTGARLLGWVFVSEEKENNVIVNMFEVPLKDDEFDGKSFDYHLRYSLTEVLVERSFEMYREVGDYDGETSAPVQVLYNLIAKPLLAILKKCMVESPEKLVVITDSYTALIPFSSLHDVKNDVFLGDLFCLQLMPSLLTMGILNQLSDTNIVHLPTDAHNMCIVGNPNIPQFKLNDEVWNLGKLPHAKKEAESVAHIMKTTPILEAQATKSAVLMRIMNSKIIHLATHGSASSGFLAFGMITSGDLNQIAHSQGVLLYPEEIEKLNINPALVVLSSCDSGRGAVKADGIQGMARAFILAGAQAVLTTLWRVPDESASVFMQFFYQYMMDGFESTKALQKAILSIRCFSKYSQYIHWSGYQLTGRDVYLKYTSPEETQMLEKHLGKSNVFPRLQDVKLLESNLVDTTCYPTDVQILEASPGLDAHEIVIDFVHSSYKHFTGGIYWINCELAEFIAGSLKYIENIVGGPLEKLEFSELQQCLFIFDSVSELPSSESLLKLMANRYTHCIMLYQNCQPPDDLIRSIDHKLIRGSKFHHVEPLSMILSTQRIVYAMQQATHFCPKSLDQMIIGKISNYSSGSPILVNIVSRLIHSLLSDSSPELLNGFLVDFERSVTTINITSESHAPSPSSSTSSRSSSPSLSFLRHLSGRVTETLTSVSVLAPECRDEWATPGSYDSWDFIAGLISACSFDPETRLLLNCLSHLGCGPIPLSIVSHLSNVITKMSGRTHLAGALISQLMELGFVKVYPSPVVICSNLGQEVDNEFICVPKFVSDYILKELECPNTAIALATCFCTLSQKALPYSSFTTGTIRTLMTLLELNSDVVGESCYGKAYQLYLSFI